MAALLADFRTDGFGWPLWVAGGEFAWLAQGRARTSQVVEAVLLVTAAAMLAAAVLGRVGRLVRWRNLPGAVAGVAVLVGVAVTALHPEVPLDMIAPDIGLRLGVLMPVALGLATLCLAVGAALTSGARWRPAAVGLIAVGALAWTGFTSLSDMDPLQAQFSPAVELRWEATPLRSVEMIWPADLNAWGATPSVVENPGSWPTITEREPDVAAVQDLRSWPDLVRDLQDGWLAIKAALIAAGLAALVMSLFPHPPRPSGSLY
ncbi:hypothetical protein [Actinoplanes philippinensis]|uniref:hypothetical protein n=1 Tax=Actinoplanes philippinensis TaxID=35752 RepID=UPI001160DF17|nr:hypothetical protein [Actinoplanes philippinensis]